MRAIWKAEVRVGKESVPVKLYSAVQEGGVHFRLLHGKDHSPVKQEMVEAGRGTPVPKEATQRGIELEPATIVVLKPEELQPLEPEASKEIRVEEFVEPSQVDLRWFDRPYYLGPDEDEGSYFALAEALAARKRVGIARWVMRRKRYQGALFVKQGYLVLSTLRHAEEMVSLGELRPPADRAPDAREIALAEQLVSALEDHFDPAAYRDEYRDRVMQLIDAKAKGRVIKMPAPKPKPKRASLAATLEASLRATKERARG